ncbi:MAG: acetate/propionate family kinase [Verrucomicrobiales bacterium]|nr:acetate kinase [Verrucomicrobiota bacterium JB025]
MSSSQTVLVINCGSSSVKFALMPPTGEAILTGIADRIGADGTILKWKIDGEKHERQLPGADLTACIREIMTILPADVPIDAIGHRVVHGAEQFSASVRICENVIASLEECTPLAPLHNPANLAGIRATTELFPDKPQVGVFDTAFHQTLPPKAFLYAVPYEWYTEDRIRRYGFHGTSHRYVSEEAARILGRPQEGLAIITAHLGNGCSATAVENGKSLDTTMGISPLEGLVMGTRSGDVDPALHEFLAKRKGWSLDRIMQALHKESGMLGLSGMSNDLRTIEDASLEGHERALMSLEVFAYRLAKAIMGLTAALSHLDAIIFTGGVGEKSFIIRALVIEQLAILGPVLDPERNDINGRATNGLVTTDDSFPCIAIPTNEELMIARETLAVIADSQP